MDALNGSKNVKLRYYSCNGAISCHILRCLSYSNLDNNNFIAI